MFDAYRERVAKVETGYLKNPQFQRLPSMNKLKVFVLPFTHVDPSWLQTFDSYSKETDAILDNMHNFMTTNPNMTFMWAELAFFERWWIKQSAAVRENIRRQMLTFLHRLVQSGRLELASGSWVMTDEANVYYPVTVDNIVEGHQFLKQELGIKRAVINR
ncbi:unnamed protein product, partial [Strongylus vulgaris]